MVSIEDNTHLKFLSPDRNSCGVNQIMVDEGPPIQQIVFLGVKLNLHL